jgi:replicative DNA helicase Mcm
MGYHLFGRVNRMNIKGLREITVDVIDQEISVPAMVVRSSEVKPMGTKISYKCECGQLNEGKIQGLTFKIPKKCSACNGIELELDPFNCEFIDYQKVRLQELPEDLPAGQLPDYIDVQLTDVLVNECRPGDRVLLTGIVRIEQQEKSTLFNLRMEGKQVEYIGGSQSKTQEISETDEYEILALSKDLDIYNKLVQSFAPNIYGNEIIKESILLLIVGSTSRKLGEGKRGDINIFLVGDPGMAKSELLKFAAYIAPRGLYTSGRGVTAAGLTAAVVKDEDMYTLEAGAIVLADQGLCCIDEMDKISDNDRSALHEVMEQQTCSVAKGGIVATLNARTSILAAANPNDGKYDMSRSIKENVEPIPIPLLTRFDLIHIVRDLKEPDTDKLIAAHILNIDNKDQSGEMDIDILRKYLAYAKKLQPIISDEAKKVMEEFYMKMRTVDSEWVTVTPRQLEGILRLATAHAKILLKDVVDKVDAERAINLVMKSMESIGTDLTGEVKHVGKLSEKELFFSMFTEPRTEEWLIEELTKDPRFSEVKVRNYIMSSNRKGELLYNNGVYYK